MDLNQIFYIEGHGTGTQVGDPIEANTLGKFFQRSSYCSPLLIGSVKSVIGHTEGTAGIASLIKVVLCMKHRMIPPNMNFTRINPKIQTVEYNLHIVNRPVNFPNRSITVGINSFGFGGNNAHAIVTEWSEYNSSEYFSSNSNDSPILSINEQNINLVSIENEMKTFQQYFILTFSSK
jgi:acyl transferase domain-containing protein